MKRRLILYSNIFLILFVGCVQAQVNSVDGHADARGMLKDFYNSYITTCAKRSPDAGYLTMLKKRYCTKKLLAKISAEEQDYDMLLNAQDCDEKWLKTFAIEKSKQTDIYLVSFIDNYSKKRNFIKLKVIKEKDGYKIDQVL